MDRIFEQLRVAGIRDVYWRVFNGGMAMYPSRHATIQEPAAYPEHLERRGRQFGTAHHWQSAVDFRSYDPLPDALETAADHGINLHFWYTIYEQDHGGPYLSQFAREHPEYWHTDREGNRYSGTLEYFFDEVRAYQLSIIDELLTYKPKGLLLDFVRHNATPSADLSGVHRFGYSPEVRCAYEKQFGFDPIELSPDNAQWLDFKRGILTSFIQEIKGRVSRAAPGGELGVIVWPVNNPTWLCLDLPALTADGTLDLVAIQSMKYRFDTQELAEQDEIVRPQVRSDHVKIAPSITAYNGVTRRQISAVAEEAEHRGYERLMLFEADALVKFRITTPVRAVNQQRADYQRQLQVTPSRAKALSQIDWAGIKAYADFINLDPMSSDDRADSATRIKLAYTDQALAIQFEAEGFDAAEMEPPQLEGHRQGYYLSALGARHRGFMVQAFCVFVDPELSRELYYQFSLTPDGCQYADGYGEADRPVRWHAETAVEGTTWRGALWIPYEALSAGAPRKGARWGVNVLRGRGKTRGALSWSVTSSGQVVPDELSDLCFA